MGRASIRCLLSVVAVPVFVTACPSTDPVPTQEEGSSSETSTTAEPEGTTTTPDPDTAGGTTGGTTGGTSIDSSGSTAADSSDGGASDSSGSGDTSDVDGDRDGYPASVDCDDTDPEVHPDADERCNGVDDDCDRTTLEDGLVSVDGEGSYTAIADAIAAATPGAEVRVCPGTYIESVTISMDLQLRSQDGAASTIIDANAAGPAVSVAGGEVAIEGLTLTGGSSMGFGGGLSVTGTDRVTVLDCVITGNGSTDGAGVYAFIGAQLELTQTDIVDNLGELGGGIAMNSDGSGSLTMTDCVVDGNDATETGGGVFLSGIPMVEMTGTTITGNTSVIGGGLTVIDSSVTVIDSTVADNTASDVGGGAGLFSVMMGSTLLSTNTDWGGGALDNAPDDVWVQGAGTWDAYGAGASFACDSLGCM